VSKSQAVRREIISDDQYAFLALHRDVMAVERPDEPMCARTRVVRADNDPHAFVIASQSALHPLVLAAKGKSFRAVVGCLVARKRS